jgi:large repetitive protein
MATNLITNGGFETQTDGPPPIAGNWRPIDDMALTGWSITDLLGAPIANFEGVGAGFAGTSGGEGTTAIDLVNDAPIQIAQTVNVPAAGTYTLTFLLSGGGQGSANGAQLIVNNVLIDTFTPDGDTFELVTVTLTFTTAGAQTIAFRGTGPADFQGAFIDGVSLVADDVTPPTIASISLDDLLITDADVTGTATLTITFSEAMDQTVNPTVTPSAATTLTLGSGTWTSPTTYQVAYTVADANVDLTDITFAVSGAKDLAGNTMVAAPAAATTTDVDTLNPTIGTISIDDPGVVNIADNTDGVLVTANVTGASSVVINGGVATETSSGSGVWTRTITATDGPNGIAVSAADANGNTAGPATQTFEADLTAPTLSINTVEGDDVINIVEASDGVTIGGSVSGNDGNDVEVTVTGPGGFSATLTLTPAQVAAGYTLTAAEIGAAANGDYVITATTSDDAGNPVTATSTITVDLTAPTLTVTNGSIQENTDGSVEPVSTGDVDADEGVTFSLVDADVDDDGEDDFEIDEETGEITYVGTGLDFEDDSQTQELEIKATDAAGNSTTATVTVTVTDAPVIAEDDGSSASAFATLSEDGNYVDDIGDENNVNVLPVDLSDILANDYDSDDVGEGQDDTLTVTFGTQTVTSGDIDASSYLGSASLEFGTEGDGTANVSGISGFDALAEGESALVAVEYTATNDNETSDTATVYVEVTGENDDVNFVSASSNDFSGTVTEDSGDDSLEDSGTVAFFDVDVNDTHSVTDISVTGITYAVDLNDDGDQDDAFESGDENTIADGIAALVGDLNGDSVANGIDVLLAEPDADINGDGFFNGDDILALLTDGNELANSFGYGLTATTTEAGQGGTLNWSFSMPNFAFELPNFLGFPGADEGDTVTLTYTVEITDSAMAATSSTTDIDITINGANDGPEIEDGSGTILENAPGETEVTIVGALDVDDIFDEDSFEITGTDADKFDVISDGDGGWLLVLNAGESIDLADDGNAIDSETDGTRVLTITVTDDNGESASATYTVTIDGIEGKVVNGTNGNDASLVGSNGDDTISGGGGQDNLSGGRDSDILNGGSGADFLDGGTQSDTLDGGAGADTMVGGAGSDVLKGNTGDDLFVFTFGEGGTDTIVDFNRGGVAGGDVLVLNGFNIGNGDTTLDLGELVINGPATGTLGQLLYNSSTGMLSFDANGATAGGVTDIAVINTGVVPAHPTTLIASDFLLNP